MCLYWIFKHKCIPLMLFKSEYFFQCKVYSKVDDVMQWIKRARSRLRVVLSIHSLLFWILINNSKGRNVRRLIEWLWKLGYLLTYATTSYLYFILARENIWPVYINIYIYIYIYIHISCHIIDFSCKEKYLRTCFSIEHPDNFICLYHFIWSSKIIAFPYVKPHIIIRNYFLSGHN